MTKNVCTEPTAALHLAQDPAEVLTMERLLLFTDAVFAIIMTLLTLDVRLPEGADLNTAQGFIDALMGTASQFRAYALSFAVIAMLWNTHLRRYRYLTAVNGKIVVGTVLQLLVTGLIPFATSMIARGTQTTQPLVVCFYACVITLNILIGWVTWRIAISDPVRISSQFSAAARREGDWRTASTAAIFAGSMPIAFKAPVAAMWLWALQIPANILIRMLIARDRAARRL
jgi:uncharacterized membrane protein